LYNNIITDITSHKEWSQKWFYWRVRYRISNWIRAVVVFFSFHTRHKFRRQKSCASHYSQFHQHFTRSFCANILLPTKITKPNCKYRKASKILCMQKLLLKCWWNWHLGLLLPTFYLQILFRWSHKCKKTVKLSLSFCAFGIFVQKNCS
jgi:hypothetical protein